MKKSYIETTVGIFIVIGIICIGYLTIKLGKLEIGSNSYIVYASFQSISGLKEGAYVQIAGVPVGKVNSIVLDQEKEMAVVGLKIKKNIKLTDDVIASVKTSGLIGDKFIKLANGGSEDYLKQGDMIIDTESAVDIEGLISKYAFGKI